MKNQRQKNQSDPKDPYGGAEKCELLCCHGVLIRDGLSVRLRLKAFSQH